MVAHRSEETDRELPTVVQALSLFRNKGMTKDRLRRTNLRLTQCGCGKIFSCLSSRERSFLFSGRSISSTAGGRRSFALRLLDDLCLRGYLYCSVLIYQHPFLSPDTDHFKEVKMPHEPSAGISLNHCSSEWPTFICDGSEGTLT